MQKRKAEAFPFLPPHRRGMERRLKGALRPHLFFLPPLRRGNKPTPTFLLASFAAGFLEQTALSKRWVWLWLRMS